MKEVVPLRKHIQQFATVCANITEVLGKAKADELISKSIYIISVGSNDIFEYSANATVLPDIFMANLIEAYTIHIEELYNLGAKKFGVLSVGPLGCVPVMRALDKNGSCADPMNQLAQAFYTVVSSLLQQLSSQYQGFNYSLGNLYDVTMSTILNYIVEGKMVSGLDHGIVTMKKGGRALFTLPPKLAYGEAGTDGVPPNSVINFQVELISWITVIDVFKDEGLIKRVLVKGEQIGKPSDLDEVLVKYVVTLADGTLLAKTPEEGVEFYVNDGHFCPALPKAIKTMNRGEKVNLAVQPKYACQVGSTNSDHNSHVIPPSSVLSIDLELLSFKPVISVTNDSKVMKKILKEGQGALTADEGAIVTVRYKAMLKDGSIFEKKGYDGDETLQFITGEEQVIAGLDRAAMAMRKGEHAIITVVPEYGFGSVEVRRDLATVPSFSTLSYEVEMLDFVKEKEPWEMISSERIQAAERKKDEGNILFKNGKYQRALKKYDKAATYVGEDGSFEADSQKLVKSLRVSCWLNNAACCLRLNNFHGAIELCSKVLDIEFYNVKALYRWSQAYIETADYHLAEADIKKALEADPGNREVKAAQHKLKLLQAESNKRDAKLYSNMFSQMTKRLKLEHVEDNKKNELTMSLEMEEVGVSCGSPDNEMIVDRC